ncbi:MAG: periplasmic heavy metal sensor [Pseudomonadota bacterium]
MTTSPVKILGLSIRGARNLLIGSLVVNFLIVGAVFGLGMREDGPKRPSGGAFGEISDLVAEERRERVAAIMAERSKLRRELRRARTDDWREIAEIIGATNFDPQAVSIMLHDYSDAHNERRKAAYAPVVEALSIMTYQERSAVAEKTRAFVEWRMTRRNR